MKQRIRNVAFVVLLWLAIACVITGIATADGVWLVPALVLAISANWVMWSGQ